MPMAPGGHTPHIHTRTPVDKSLRYDEGGD
jgi:hypothetical protein